MKTISLSVILASILVASSWAQSPPPTAYAESFRHGTTRITEENFEMKLTPANATYTELIKDSHGHDRYVFTAAPQVLEGRNEIISWLVKLADLQHGTYDNIFMTSQEPAPDSQNDLWRLNPSQYAAVPTDAKRIIKVESFYVIMQIKAHHFTPLDSPYLDSMTVQVEFKNTDPRAAPSP